MKKVTHSLARFIFLIPLVFILMTYYIVVGEPLGSLSDDPQLFIKKILFLFLIISLVTSIIAVAIEADKDDIVGPLMVVYGLGNFIYLLAMIYMIFNQPFGKLLQLSAGFPKDEFFSNIIGILSVTGLIFIPSEYILHRYYKKNS